MGIAEAAHATCLLGRLAGSRMGRVERWAKMIHVNVAEERERSVEMYFQPLNIQQGQMLNPVEFE